jgi:tetratricopeptide (TPR) repeat protein
MNRKAIAPIILSFTLFAGTASGREREQAPAAPAANKPVMGQTPSKTGPAATVQEPAPPSIPDLISKGKSFYKAARFKPALAAFEEVLKQDASHDEALGLAAITAYRLDIQSQSRDYFLRRAALPGQKESVKAFCFYRAALSHWRQVHVIVAKFCEFKDSRFVAVIPDQYELDVKYGIENGLDLIDRALAITKNFSEAYNIKNLLHSEAALVAADENMVGDHRQKAAAAIQRAMELFKPAETANAGIAKETADFGAPTIRVGEYLAGKADDAVVAQEGSAHKLVQGGKPIKKVNAAFPSISTPKNANGNDPAITGVGPDGSAYSLGSGRGALTAAYAPGKVKVEVLVSPKGNVVFTRIVDGRSDLRGAAILAARSWKFEPAKVNGKPVQLSGVILFNMRPPAQPR